MAIKFSTMKDQLVESHAQSFFFGMLGSLAATIVWWFLMREKEEEENQINGQVRRI